MNELGEDALVQILAASALLYAETADRITWDDEELDLPRKSVTLRTLATRLPASHMRGRGGVLQCLVEVSSHDDTSTGASRLHDLAVAALTPYEEGPSTITLTNGGGDVTFGSILLTDAQQSPSGSPRRYRKSATFSVCLYE